MLIYCLADEAEIIAAAKPESFEMLTAFCLLMTPLCPTEETINSDTNKAAKRLLDSIKIVYKVHTQAEITESDLKLVLDTLRSTVERAQKIVKTYDVDLASPRRTLRPTRLYKRTEAERLEIARDAEQLFTASLSMLSDAPCLRDTLTGLLLNRNNAAHVTAGKAIEGILKGECSLDKNFDNVKQVRAS